MWVYCICKTGLPLYNVFLKSFVHSPLIAKTNISRGSDTFQCGINKYIYPWICHTSFLYSPNTLYRGWIISRKVSPSYGSLKQNKLKKYPPHLAEVRSQNVQNWSVQLINSRGRPEEKNMGWGGGVSFPSFSRRCFLTENNIAQVYLHYF